MSAAPSDDSLADLVGRLADEFTEALQRGECPDVEAYAARHPAIASVLREVLPALKLLRLPSVAGFADSPGPGLPAAPALPDVLGDYRIIRELGRGGMGIVYEAEQISLKRSVALKVLPVHPALEAKYLARFEREAETAAALHHTNIVPVHAVGVERGVHFYAMQLIRGRGLDRLIAEMRGRVGPTAPASKVIEETVRRLPAPLRADASRASGSAASRLSSAGGSYVSIARMALQAAEALEYAHGRGVIHRDIKPSNLILDDAGIVWITDFGLVKRLDEADENLTRTGDLPGTARYMSPEQAAGRHDKVDQRSDLYSLGATLYELVTLEPAFAGSDPGALLPRILHDDPVAPRVRNKSVPRDLDTIIVRSMAKEPTRRYRGAGDLAADLRRFIAGEPIRARSPGTLERLWRWTKRRPATAALLAVIVLATAALTGGAIWSNAELREANLRERRRAVESEERERIGRHRLYAAHMNLAGQAWDRGHVAQMLALLERERPQGDDEDLRGLEWYLFRKLGSRRIRTWVAHKHTITALAYDPRGRFLITGGSDRSLRSWNPTTGELIRTWTSAGRGLTALAISRDGATLAGSDQDHLVRVWDVETGKLRRTLGGSTGPVFGVAMTADATLVAGACSDGAVRIWDLRVEPKPTTPPRGKAAPKTPNATDPTRVLPGHAGAVFAVAFDAEGTRLASGGADRSVRVWTLAGDGEPTVLVGHEGDVRCVAFAPVPPFAAEGAGVVLASAGADRTIRLWNLNRPDVARPTGTDEPAVLQGHADSIGALAFSADGRTLAAADGEPAPFEWPYKGSSRAAQLRARPGEVRLWDVATRRPRAGFRGHAGAVLAVAFAPDDRTLASGGEDMSVILWNAAGVEPRAMVSASTLEVNSVAVAPDGKFAAAAGDDRTVRLWNLKDPSADQAIAGFAHPVKAVAYSADGSLLAVGGGDRAVTLWDPRTLTRVRELSGHTRTLRGLAFSADGSLLASAAGDTQPKPIPGEAALWDVATGRRVFALEGHSDCARSVAFSPDGKTLASGADDGSVKLWNVADGKLIRTIGGLPHAARSVAFSPDGRTLAIACGGVWNAHEPGTVRLWDLKEDRERAVLAGHRAAVMAAAFTGDGRTIATGGVDGTVKLWDPVTAQERASLEGHQGLIRTLAISRDGRTLVSGDSRGVVRFWFADE